VTDLTNKIVTV